TATAGSAFNYTVTARDAFKNTATGYSGTVRFTKNDSQARLPGASPLHSRSASLTATLRPAGSRTLSATDTANSSITGTSNPISVSAAALSKFVVSAPATATTGSALSITVSATDAFNNTISTYSGTVHFTKTDSGSGSAVPAD